MILHPPASALIVALPLPEGAAVLDAPTHHAVPERTAPPFPTLTFAVVI